MVNNAYTVKSVQVYGTPEEFRSTCAPELCGILPELSGATPRCYLFIIEQS